MTSPLLEHVFPSIWTRARLAIVPFQWLVCRRASSAPPATPGVCGRFWSRFCPPPRHNGGTRQVFDG